MDMREMRNVMQDLSTEKQSRPRNIEGIAFPIILGALIVSGSYAASTASVPFKHITFYLEIVLFSFGFYWIFQLGNWLIDRSTDDATYVHVGSIEQRAHHISLSGVIFYEHSEHFLPCVRDAIRLFICWSPYLVLLYPGVLYWDTGDQLGQYFGISVFGQKPGVIWDHHPFFDTYLYGGIVSIGHRVFGSYQAGIFLYSLAQFCFVDFVLAMWLAYLSSRGVTKKLLTITTMFVAFFPVFPIMMVAMSKDITHTAIFMLWTLLFIKLVTGRMEKLRSIWFNIVFLGITLLASLTEKIGVYIIIVCILTAVFVQCKKRYKPMLVGLGAVSVLITNFVIPTYLFPVLHVIPGGPQAALAVPIQMTARASKYHHADITEDELKSVNGFLLNSWDELGQKYVQYISDPVTAYNVRNPNEQSGFLKAWLSIGLRHPFTYLDSFIAQESGWISFVGSSGADVPKHPDLTVPLQTKIVTTTVINEDSFGRLMPNQDPNRMERLVANILSALMSVPVINSIFYVATWTAVLPIFFLFLLWKSRKRMSWANAVECAPYIVSWLVLCVYPVSLTISQDSTRYMFHLIMLFPMMLALATTFSSTTRPRVMSK